MGDTLTSPPIRLRRSRAQGNARSDNAADTRATARPVARCRRFFARGRARPSRPRFPLDAQVALGPARTALSIASSSWCPTRSHSERGTPPHHLLPARYRFHQMRQLIRQEAAHYRHNTIVSAHRMKVEYERSQPQTAGGYEAAAKVTDHYASA